MNLIEFNTHSFIVKIWLEEPAENHRKGRWRGHITHVPSGQRRYLKSLGEIVTFIVPYLISMGVRLQAYWRLRSWLWKRPRAQGTGQEMGMASGGGNERMPTRFEPPGGRPVEQ